MLLHPNAGLELCALETGRWGAPELVERAASMDLRFQPNTVAVESNGPQRFVLETLGARGLPVLEHPTGGGQWSMGGRFGELEVDMGNNRVLFPSVDGRPRDDSVAKLCRTMTYYARNDHPPDPLVALALACWAVRTAGAREARWLPQSFANDMLRR